MGVLLPNPLVILVCLLQLLVTGSVYPDVFASLTAITIGFAFSACMGIGLAVFISRYPLASRPILGVADLIRPVSALALFPVIIIGLGLGLAARSFVIFWTAWPPVLIVSLHALDEIPCEVTDAAAVDGSTGWHRLAYVLLPLALPGILAGLRVSVSAAWISLTAAEMLGAASGLGYSVLQFAQAFRYGDMYAVIVVIAVLGFLMAALFNGLYALSERWLFQ